MISGNVFTLGELNFLSTSFVKLCNLNLGWVNSTSRLNMSCLMITRTLPPEGAVLFCNEASGDEEVPQLVRGVVVSRDLPVLSHLALRARQLGVVFACTAESQLFEQLRQKVQEKKPVKLMVDAAGDVRAEVQDQSVAFKFVS